MRRHIELFAQKGIFGALLALSSQVVNKKHFHLPDPNIAKVVFRETQVILFLCVNNYYRYVSSIDPIIFELCKKNFKRFLR